MQLTRLQEEVIKVGYSQKNTKQKSLDILQEQFEHLDEISRKELYWALRINVGEDLKLAPQFSYLEKDFNIDWLENLIRYKKIENILNFCGVERTKICLLKGGAMMVSYYKNMGFRPYSSDIDILVETKYISIFIKLLKKAGFRVQPLYSYSGAELEEKIECGDKSILEILHAVTLNNDHFLVDVHWRLTPLFSNCGFTDLENELLPITFMGRSIFVPKVDLMFVHICIHGMSKTSDDKKNYWVFDNLYLLRFFGKELDWDNVYKISRDRNCLNFIRDFLLFAQEVNPKLVSKKVVQKFMESASPGWVNFVYALQTSRVKLLQKVGFYLFSYSASNDSFSVIKLMQFMKNYLGIEKTSTFCKLLMKRIVGFHA